MRWQRELAVMLDGFCSDLHESQSPPGAVVRGMPSTVIWADIREGGESDLGGGYDGRRTRSASQM